jgi:hypothetical protein
MDKLRPGKSLKRVRRAPAQPRDEGRAEPAPRLTSNTVAPPQFCIDRSDCLQVDRSDGLHMREWRTEVNSSNYRMGEQQVEGAVGEGWANCDGEADEGFADF